MRILFAFFVALLLGASGARADGIDFSTPIWGIACTTSAAAQDITSLELVKPQSFLDFEVIVAGLNAVDGHKCELLNNTKVNEPHLMGYFKSPKGHMYVEYSFKVRGSTYFMYAPSPIPFA